MIDEDLRKSLMTIANLVEQLQRQLLLTHMASTKRILCRWLSNYVKKFPLIRAFEPINLIFDITNFPPYII